MSQSILQRVSERGQRAMIANVDLLRDAKKNTGRVRSIILDYQNSTSDREFLSKYKNNDLVIARSVIKAGCARIDKVMEVKHAC